MDNGSRRQLADDEPPRRSDGRADRSVAASDRRRPEPCGSITDMSTHIEHSVITARSRPIGGKVDRTDAPATNATSLPGQLWCGASTHADPIPGGSRIDAQQCAGYATRVGVLRPAIASGAWAAQQANPGVRKSFGLDVLEHQPEVGRPVQTL